MALGWRLDGHARGVTRVARGEARVPGVRHPERLGGHPTSGVGVGVRGHVLLQRGPKGHLRGRRSLGMGGSWVSSGGTWVLRGKMRRGHLPWSGGILILSHLPHLRGQVGHVAPLWHHGMPWQ